MLERQVGRSTTYEDSKNRYPTDGIRDVVGRTNLLLPQRTTKVILVMKKYGVPLVVFENFATTTHYSSRRKRHVTIPRYSASFQSDRIISGMRAYRTYNSSRFKTDLIFHPDLKLRLGNYNQPLEGQKFQQPQ